jgi:acyl carrier protein
VQVAETIKRIIAKQLSRAPEDISDDSDLTSLGIESLDLLEIVYEVETQFGIQIPYNANEPGAVALSTVGDVVRTVETLVNAR